MPKSHHQSPKNVIPQRLLDEESRLKDQGLIVKETRFNRNCPNKLS